MSNTARRLLWPKTDDVLVRVAFLHVGQGSSAIVFIADRNTYLTLLVDINLDSRAGGIDVPQLMVDLVGAHGLDIFVNTHPHNDHLCGLAKLSASITIREVWHSGHNPGREHSQSFGDLKELLRKVQKAGGNEVELEASRSPFSIGDAQCYILSPAEYVKDEIGDEKPSVRYNRIHEHSAVLKFGIDDTWIMIPGDADVDAWRIHITDYHKERLQAVVLAAPHHGSRTFFHKNEEDAPYMDALQAIDPTYVIISAPIQEQSRFTHPHDNARELYAQHVGEANVLHTGADRHCFICDVYRDGSFKVYSDDGELAEAYPYCPDEGDIETAKKIVSVSKETHVATPPWQMQRQYSVNIRAQIYHVSIDIPVPQRIKLGDIASDGRMISSGMMIKFIAKTSAPGDCEFWWQVTNTGLHAQQSGQLRGEITRWKSINWESTSYTGKHWVECFLVREGVCVGRSGRFFVNIRNPTFLRNVAQY